MTFAAHGALGAGVTLAILSPLHPDPVVNWTAGFLGFVAGSLPDTADWFAATFLNKPRWVLYSRMHHGDLTWIAYFCAPYGLHIWLDTYIHDPLRPGWNWFGERWYMEVLMWIVSGLLFWIALK